MLVLDLPTPEGWKAEFDLGGWLVTYGDDTEVVHPPTDGHPSMY